MEYQKKMTPTARHLLARVARVLDDLGIDLEPTQCRVEKQCMHLTVRTVPETAEARRMMASAAQVAVLEEFADMPKLQWDVTVPSPLPRRSETTAAWMQKQALGMQDFWRAAVRAHLEAACAHVLDAYPWRDGAAMAARIPLLVAEARADTVSFFDPALLDAFLPSLDAHLLPADRMTVLADATKHRGAPLATVLDVYEHVYDLVVCGGGTAPTRHLFHAVFDAS